jgi:hypothetical protein
VAATLYTVVSPVSDSIDLNYQTWMALPWVASGWAFVAALARGRVALYVLAGALVVLAAQVKHQCAALGPMYALLVIASRYVALPDGFTPGPVGRGLAGLVGGAVLGFVPLGLWYAAHGALGDFLGTFFLSEGGWKYARSPLDLGEKLLRLGDGLLGFWEYLALPTVLAAGALLGLRRGLRRPTLVGLLLLGLFGAGFLAAAVGFRFYKSYYLHLLPALALAAAAPGNLAALLLERTTYRWSPPGRRLQGLLVASGVGVLLVFAAAQDAGNLRQIRQERRFARDLDAQRVAKVVAAHSAPEDRIWVWGRWAWPVYFHTDRRAASRNYKVMNVLTTPLTNTWRRPGTPSTSRAACARTPASGSAAGRKRAAYQASTSAQLRVLATDTVGTAAFRGGAPSGPPPERGIAARSWRDQVQVTRPAVSARSGAGRPRVENDGVGRSLGPSSRYSARTVGSGFPST